MSKYVTRQKMIDFLANQPEDRVIQYVGRALVVIFNNQTASEKDSDQTVVHNGEGFTPADAHSGGLTAKYFLKHRSMLDWQLERWVKPNAKGVPRIAKYWKQLNAEAERKSKNRIGKGIANGNYSQAKRQEKRVENGPTSVKTFAQGAWIPPDDLQHGTREYWEQMYEKGSPIQRELAAESLGKKQPNMGNRVMQRRANRAAANPGSL